LPIEEIEEMKLKDYPGVTKVWTGTRLSLPDPNVYHMLYVETNVPLLKKQRGYDQASLENLLHAVGETMDEIGADKAEIYNPEAGDNFIIADHSP
jgi:hypothetical protein